jgi:hypothetical protein
LICVRYITVEIERIVIGDYLDRGGISYVVGQGGCQCFIGQERTGRTMENEEGIFLMDGTTNCNCVVLGSIIERQETRLVVENTVHIPLADIAPRQIGGIGETNLGDNEAVV